MGLMGLQCSYSNTTFQTNPISQLRQDLPLIAHDILHTPLTLHPSWTSSSSSSCNHTNLTPKNKPFTFWLILLFLTQKFISTLLFFCGLFNRRWTPSRRRRCTWMATWIPWRSLAGVETWEWSQQRQADVPSRRPVVECGGANRCVPACEPMLSPRQMAAGPRRTGKRGGVRLPNPHGRRL